MRFLHFSEYSPRYLERCDMAPFSEKCKNLTREISTYERIRDKYELSLQQHTHLVLVHQLSHLFSGGSVVKNLPAMQETLVQSLGQEDPLEKGMATHSSILGLENSMDRGAQWATVHGVAKSQT